MANIPRHIAEAYAEYDPTLQRMLRRNLPLNRETYIAANWPDTIDEWTAEHELEMPEPFRDPGSLPQLGPPHKD